MRKVIITAALTGGGHGKKANPNLPEQPDEIIRQALECEKAGAAIIHIHARNKKGESTMDVATFQKIYEGIKNASKVNVEMSTGGGPELSMEERIAPLMLKPELASLNTFIIMLGTKGKEQPAIYTRAEIEASARRAQKLGVKPSVAVINFSCLEEAENLIEKKLLSRPYYFSMGLGLPAQGALKATTKNLITLIDRMPADSLFTVSAHGLEQAPLTTLGLLLGGHVRIGMEDSVFYALGRLAASNAELVARTVRIIKELNLQVATVEEAKEMLKLGG